MTVVYDPHLQERLRERHIPEAWPREIVETTTELYRDTVTGLYVAIGKRWYKGKDREMVVSYIEQGAERKAITIHPIQANQKRNRIDKGRWAKYEGSGS